MRFSWILKLALLGMAVWGGGKTALADIQYTFTRVAIPGASYTYPNAINDRGQIVGTYSPLGSGHGFLYSDGSYTTIDVSGSLATFAAGINDSGQIVGYYDPQIGPTVTGGFLYSSGTFTTLDYPGAAFTFLEGINNLGQVVGYFEQSVSGPSQGFVYSAGKFSLIDYPGATSTSALGINDSGQIVGSFDTVSSSGCYLYSGGSFTMIGPPCAFANGLNNANQIVGMTLGEAAFLYSNGAFVRTNLPPSFSEADGINDRGQIVGFATGPLQGFLTTPTVPQPRTLPVLTASLLALFIMAWRRKRAPHV